MPNWIGDNRWNSILTLLNEKRVAMGFSSISHTFSDWVKQSDINCLRDGLIEILPSYGYTLATALVAAGYGYSTWKTWAFNWIAEVSLDEIEDILNILEVAVLSVHSHTPEGKELGSVLTNDGWSNLVNIYYALDSDPTNWIYLGHGSESSADHPKIFIGLPNVPMTIKETFNGMEILNHIDNLQMITFNWIRAETFDLVDWLDSCNTPNDANHSQNVNIPAGTYYDSGEHPINTYYLTNSFSFAHFRLRFGTYDGADVSVVGTSHSEFTSEIFKRNIYGIISWSGNYGWGDGLYIWGVWGGNYVNHTISISVQAFDYWYYGDNGHRHYPQLTLQGGADVLLIDKADEDVKEIATCDAKLSYNNLRQYHPGFGISEVGQHIKINGGNYSFEDNSGYCSDFFFSSIPYDLTGLAI